MPKKIVEDEYSPEINNNTNKTNTTKTHRLGGNKGKYKGANKTLSNTDNITVNTNTTNTPTTNITQKNVIISKSKSKGRKGKIRSGSKNSTVKNSSETNKIVATTENIPVDKMINLISNNNSNIINLRNVAGNSLEKSKSECSSHECLMKVLMASKEIDPDVMSAMMQFNRNNIITSRMSDEDKHKIYYNNAVNLGFDDITSTKPSDIGRMLSLLHIEKNSHVLEIGCGGGYTTGIISHLINNYGYYVGTERIRELAEHTKKMVEKHLSERNQNNSPNIQKNSTMSNSTTETGQIPVIDEHIIITTADILNGDGEYVDENMKKDLNMMEFNRILISVDIKDEQLLFNLISKFAGYFCIIVYISNGILYQMVKIDTKLIKNKIGDIESATMVQGITGSSNNRNMNNNGSDTNNNSNIRTNNETNNIKNIKIDNISSTNNSNNSGNSSNSGKSVNDSDEIVNGEMEDDGDNVMVGEMDDNTKSELSSSKMTNMADTTDNLRSIDNNMKNNNMKMNNTNATMNNTNTTMNNTNATMNNNQTNNSSNTNKLSSTNNMLLKPAKTINTSQNTNENSTITTTPHQPQPAKNNLELKRNNLQVLASNNTNQNPMNTQTNNVSNNNSSMNSTNSMNRTTNLNNDVIDSTEMDDGLVNTSPQKPNNIKVINL